jgi:hypothetical protein
MFGDRSRHEIAGGAEMLACQLITASLLIIVAPQVHAQQTYYVDADNGDDAWDGLCQTWDGSTCGPKQTIQAAIDVTVGGDEVVLAGGTYSGVGNRELDYVGKGITVRSASGDPNRCIIDCGGVARGFVFDSGEMSSSVVDSLTVTNGFAGVGAGIYCNAASPSIIRCRIISNVGGGIYCESASASIADSTISHNTGDGVYFEDASASISGSTLTHNTDYGARCIESNMTHISTSIITHNSLGGIYCAIEDQTTVSGCTIHENGGSGITCQLGSSTDVVGCVTDCNQGSGIECGWASHLIISKSSISGNSTNGITSNDSDFRINGCLISGNLSRGISCNSSDSDITNCTISGNNGGAYCRGSGVSNSTLTNSILWNNASAGGSEISIAGRGTLSVSYSNISGGEAAVDVDPGCPACNLDWGVGNLDVDPVFAGPCDYHLQSSSPCIDAGTHTPPGGLPTTDLDGANRNIDGDNSGTAMPDMGAYEYDPNAPLIGISTYELSYSVRAGEGNPESQVIMISNPGGVPLNWAASSDVGWLTLDITSGVIAAGGQQDVMLTVDISGLAAGAYYATLTVSAPQAVNSPRTVTVSLVIGDRLDVPGEYATIQAAIDAAMDGDIVVIADGTYTGDGNHAINFQGKIITVRSENGPDSCIVDLTGRYSGFMFCSGETPDSVLRGITIQNHAVDYLGTPHDAGIVCSSASPTIEDCIILDGARYGIKSNNGSPEINNCYIAGNSSGGMQCTLNSAEIYNCYITKNSGLGGINSSNCDMNIHNCVIVGNSSSWGYAGGVECDGGSVLISNCTIMDNRGNGDGTAFYSACAATIVNTILWNSADEVGSEINIYGQSTVAVSYSDVEGGGLGVFLDPSCTGCTLNWGAGNIDHDPLFAFPDDLRLQAASPCIDSGTDTPPGGLSLADIAGNFRNLDGDGDALPTPDMGAYEFNPNISSIAVSPLQLTFSAIENEAAPASQSLSIRNAGGGSLNWHVMPDSARLNVDVSSGDSMGEVDKTAVSIDHAGLAPGQYQAELIISDPNSDNSPRMVIVDLAVGQILSVPGDYGTIQAAIDAAIEGDAVVVSDGTYTGVGNVNVSFRGKGITVRSEYGAANCIIDCQNTARGFIFENSEPVTAVLQGFTINNGYHNWAGGGIACFYESSPTIIDCVFRNNWAESGGAIFGGDLRHISDCVFINNGSADGGGAIFYSGTTNVRIERCLFEGNISGYGSGGGIFALSDISVIECQFKNNLAPLGGGASLSLETASHDSLIVNSTFSSGLAEYGGACAIAPDSQGQRGTLTMVNCVLNGNEVSSYGGGIYAFGSGLDMINCTVYANEARMYAGGIFAGSDVSIQNSIVWDNLDTNGRNGELVQVYDPGCCGLIDINNSSISGWTGYYGGTGNTPGSSIGFIDPYGEDNTPYTGDEDLRLAADSIHCIDAGNNAAVPPDVLDIDNDGDTSEPIPLDRDSDLRFLDDPNTPDTGSGTPPIIDMGAFEFTLGGDIDKDFDIDIDDLNLFVDCMAGPEIPLPPGCDAISYGRSDVDNDDDVDLADYRRIQIEQ